MKKIFSIIALFIYLFAASSLTHASTMGFFAMSHDSDRAVSQCHSDTSSDKPTQNMDCCELFTSNQYSQVGIGLQPSIKYLPRHISPTLRLSTLQTFDLTHFGLDKLSGPPGIQNTRSKYVRFSDLFGIIVSLS